MKDIYKYSTLKELRGKLEGEGKLAPEDSEKIKETAQGQFKKIAISYLVLGLIMGFALAMLVTPAFADTQLPYKPVNGFFWHGTIIDNFTYQGKIGTMYQETSGKSREFYFVDSRGMVGYSTGDTQISKLFVPLKIEAINLLKL